jgi:hypothetical protein
MAKAAFRFHSFQERWTGSVLILRTSLKELKPAKICCSEAIDNERVALRSLKSIEICRCGVQLQLQNHIRSRVLTYPTSHIVPEELVSTVQYIEDTANADSRVAQLKYDALGYQPLVTRLLPFIWNPRATPLWSWRFKSDPRRECEEIFHARRQLSFRVRHRGPRR